MKVYISKSNNGKTSDLEKVRGVLETFGGVEVLEYKGGSYSTKTLLSADLLLIIPPKWDEDGNANVGKGQYIELNTWCDYMKNKAILCQIADNTVYACTIDTYGFIDNNWTTEYGSITPEEGTTPLSIFIAQQLSNTTGMSGAISQKTLDALKEQVFSGPAQSKDYYDKRLLLVVSSKK